MPVDLNVSFLFSCAFLSSRHLGICAHGPAVHNVPRLTPRHPFVSIRLVTLVTLVTISWTATPSRSRFLSYNGYLEVMRILLAYGADVNI